METLEELEWCLEQLEMTQTDRSVSDLATNKVSATLLLAYTIFRLLRLQERQRTNNGNLLRVFLGSKQRLLYTSVTADTVEKVRKKLC